MVSPYMFDKVRSLKGQGKRIGQIAKELKIDRKTASKYFHSNTPPVYSARTHSTRQDPLAGYFDRAKFLMKENEDWNSVDLYEVLKDEGYSGSEKTVRRRMILLKPPKDKERFFQQEYDPGEQSQFDFKEKVGLPFIDGLKIINLFFGTLPCSDHFFIKGFPFKNLECFQEGMHSFFEDIGGLTKNIRFDNLSPCVKKVLKGNERIYTEDFKKTSNYYGFGLLPCSPGKGNEKGDVEREIRTHARRLQKLAKFQKINFRDFAQLNKWLEEYCKKRLAKGNREKFEVEKKSLLPLPPREESILCRIEQFTGGPYGTVTLRDAIYSIPDSFIGRSCEAVLGPYEVFIKNNTIPSMEIVVHPRKGEGEKSILLSHILPSLLRKPAAMVRWSHREILFPSPVFKKYYGYLKSLDSLRAEKSFLKSVNLIQHSSWKDMEVGMVLVMETASTTPFEDLKDLLLGGKRPPVKGLVGQIPLKPNLKIYDYFIP